MHKSRLGNVVIDCHTNKLDDAAAFWAKALGWDWKKPPDPNDASYRELESPKAEVNVLVQAVSHPSRVHMDIETDDVEAETVRLEKLGARRIEHVRGWWIMEAPTGQRFCVVPLQRAGFEAQANVWESAR